MEGSTHNSRSLAQPSYIGDGNPGPYGGGTLTGQSLDPMVEDYMNIFGPAGRDVKIDHQRHKRQSRLHLPDVLKGPNQFLTDRIDGLISDATNSPFTSVILPYTYIDNPDRKITWRTFSYDEGLASRVPYESAARTLTQTKRSFKAFLVRHGLAITMEHNFMMSPEGRKDFSNQLLQLVGSIQYSNDLDVHIALVSAPSYAQTWAEKYNTSDKTDSQICREFVDMFGFLQKNPNALDIIIEDAKQVMKLWGSPPPSFLLCNQKLTFQMTMIPEKTNYMTQGIDGIKRLRAGPDLGSYRGLNIINTRAFSMEIGAPPRDILRRRVRVAEFYRIPPQGANSRWVVELYDESRDTWFSVRRDELDRHARLDDFGHTHYNIPADFTMTFNDYQSNPSMCNYLHNVEIVYPTTANWTAKLIKPANSNLNFCIPSRWDEVVQNIQTMSQGIYNNKAFRKHHYKTIVDSLPNVGYLRPNHIQLNTPLSSNATQLQACSWLSSQAAFLPTTMAILWYPIPTISMQLMEEAVIPFLFPEQGVRDQAIASYHATCNEINPYNCAMTLALVATLHPNLEIQRQISEAMRSSRIHVTSLRSVIARFIRSAFHPRHAERPANRIQLGRLLEEYMSQAFLNIIGTDPALQANALYDPWPSENVAGVYITHYANVSETHDSMANPSVEQAYDAYGRDYTWNTLQLNNTEVSISNLDEDHALSCFLIVAIRRIFGDPSMMTEQIMFPDQIAHLEVKDRGTDDYEYVIIRPCIEHNMLGIIMGRGGSEELGCTFWGQTELSCYDDSFHGVWGMSYKYHERALVLNERNMIRMWDVAYDGYNGGKDDSFVNWTDEAPGKHRPFNRCATDMSVPYQGPSMMVMRFKVDKTNTSYKTNWPSPIVFHDKYLNQPAPKLSPDPDSIYVVQNENMRIFNSEIYREQYRMYAQRMPDFSYFHQVRKPPGNASIDMETTQNALAFQGTFRIKRLDNNNMMTEETLGSGHHGPDYIGVAMLRAGKGIKPEAKAPALYRMI
jgi:hypothetical protein